MEQSAENPLSENLKDAGCDEKDVRRCLALADSHEYCALLQLLVLHRRTLLAAMHDLQDQMDCLDYLIYKLKKEDSL